jgi:hypothetical protein
VHSEYSYVDTIELLLVFPARNQYPFTIKLSDYFVSELSLFHITFFKALILASEKGYFS